MGERSQIEWTTHTFNGWWGCTEASEGCDHCYARVFAKYTRGMAWGKGTPRMLTSDANWRKPLAWDRAAKAAGERHRVFCMSMADTFDAEVPKEWRERLWGLVRQTPNLDWLMLTKRPGNIRHMLPPDWGEEGWPNVWLGASVENQVWAKPRIMPLLDVPAAVHFLSCEPLLGPLDLRDWLRSPGMPKRIVKPHSQPIEYLPVRGIDWVIAGYESGNGARLGDPDWARSLRDQVERSEAGFLFKQWGDDRNNPDPSDPTRKTKENPKGSKGGRTLDGRIWNEAPRARAVA